MDDIKLYVDATMLDDWGKCREFMRQRYMENRVPSEPAIALEVGTAFHLGIEAFWRGAGYEDAMRDAMRHLNSLDRTHMPLRSQEKLDEALGFLPDMLSVYFDNVTYKPVEAVEVNWQHKHPLLPVMLCGRIDRYDAGVIYDAKTASDIGDSWKQNYKAELLMKWGFRLYDWYMVQSGKTPRLSVAEVVTKPYRSKPARFHRIELPEIAAYRLRTQQQLYWILKEMLHYVTTYPNAQPWPMSPTACVGKYGPCDYLNGCCNGWSQKTLERFTKRKEHLVNLPEQRINNGHNQKNTGEATAVAGDAIFAKR